MKQIILYKRLKLRDDNMIDKDFCLSSYMAFRYIYKDNIDFFDGMKHETKKLIPIKDRIPVKTAKDIDNEIQKQIDALYETYEKIGILLSGGMDSGILASYLKPGSNAYTFSTTLSEIYVSDIKQAKKYCEKLKLNHNIVDISFEDYKKYTPTVMKNKCSPVHSIEPQIYKAAQTAKNNGDEILIIGDGSDYVFGGMDKLLSKDWDFDEFVKRYNALEPSEVLKNPIDMTEPYEKYRLPNNKIDFLGFMNDLTTIESYDSYSNAFKSAEMEYTDPYEKLIMEDELDLDRVRNGESKYLIRELYGMKYPEFKIPDKIPMPRPVDYIFKNWEGPKRKEFKENIPLNELTGNQKWQLWCAELFLNLFEK